jgi:hypothetical protein
MRHQNNIFILLAVILLAAMSASLSAQEATTAPTPAPIGQVMGKRDKSKEDQIAKLFEKARSDLKLPRLGRIEYRCSLEAKVCTMALTGAISNWDSIYHDFGLYKTTRAESITQELQKAASYDGQNPSWHKSPKYEKYSIAVWAVKDSETGETTFWVGAYLYLSAGLEFFGNHFTDGWDYRNEWKKYVAPECLSKR